MIRLWSVVSVALLMMVAGSADGQEFTPGPAPTGTAVRADAANRFVVGSAAAEGLQATLTAVNLGTGTSGGDAGKGSDRAPRLTAVWKAEDLWPLTCAQAWETAGRSSAGLAGIVRALARVSLANRQLLFPDTREAGLDAGKAIAEECKEDPAGLLIAIVDKHARRVAEAAASPRQ